MTADTAAAERATESKAPGAPDLATDHHRVEATLKDGGVCIIPGAFGYGFSGATPDAALRINAAKQRGPHKRLGFAIPEALRRDLHMVGSVKEDMIRCVTQDFGLAVGVIARYRLDHPVMQRMDPLLIKVCTGPGPEGRTVGTLVGSGSIGRRFAEIEFAEKGDEYLMHFATSANLSGHGTKHRVEDIEPEVRAAADLVIDYGLISPHYKAGMSSTHIDFDTMTVLRIGIYYAQISNLLKRYFNVDLPPDPGHEVHMNELEAES